MPGIFTMSYDETIARIIPEIEHHQNRYARGLDAVITDGSRWLDLGSGTRIHHGWKGNSPAALAERAASVIGCDLVPQHLAQNAELDGAVVADGSQLPFDGGSFDVVSANMVLEHLPSPLVVFREAARVLAPGGVFVFVTPNRRNPIVATAKAVLSQGNRRSLASAVEARSLEHVFPTFYAANASDEIGRLAQASGFQVTLLDTFNSYPFCRAGGVLTAVECMYIRLLSRRLRHLTTNLFGVLTRIGSYA